MRQIHCVAVAAVFLAGGNMMPVQAETCLHACVDSRHLASTVTDDEIRYVQKSCRDICTATTIGDMQSRGLKTDIDRCRQEPLSDTEYKAIRSASASFSVQANMFTWDLHNILPHKVIRSVTVVTQSLALAEVELTGVTVVPPRSTETVLVAGFFDGYPNVRFATRVKAIYACTVE